MTQICLLLGDMQTLHEDTRGWGFRHYLREQSQGHHTTDCFGKRGVEKGCSQWSFLKLKRRDPDNVNQTSIWPLSSQDQKEKNSEAGWISWARQYYPEVSRFRLEIFSHQQTCHSCQHGLTWQGFNIQLQIHMHPKMWFLSFQVVFGSQNSHFPLLTAVNPCL